MNIKRLLALRPKGESSTDLREAMQNANRELQQAEQLKKQLEASRGELLLSGSAEAVEALQARLAEVRATEGNLLAMVAALAPRIVAAEKREAEEQLDRVEADAKAKADKARKLVPEVFDLMARLADLVEEHDRIVDEIHVAGTQLRAGGRDRVRPPLPDYWARQLPESGGPQHLTRLGPHLALPGPRASHQDLRHWRAEVVRAQTPAEDRAAAD